MCLSIALIRILQNHNIRSDTYVRHMYTTYDKAVYSEN